jgi:hypothetical protein
MIEVAYGWLNERVRQAGGPLARRSHARRKRSSPPAYLAVVEGNATLER